MIVGALRSVLGKEEIKSCSPGKITGIGEGNISLGAHASLFAGTQGQVGGNKEVTSRSRSGCCSYDLPCAAYDL